MTARILKKHNVEVAHKPTSKLKSIFNKHKDHRKPLDRNNVIYKIPCQHCEQVYIGETSKTANTRITEHKNAIRREVSRSLPATHVINHDHRFDWTKTAIIDHATTREARELKEAWHRLQNSVINRHIDIPTAYNYLSYQYGSRTTNKITEQNQPINIAEKRPNQRPRKSTNQRPTNTANQTLTPPT